MGTPCVCLWPAAVFESLLECGMSRVGFPGGEGGGGVCAVFSSFYQEGTEGRDDTSLDKGNMWM